MVIDSADKLIEAIEATGVSEAEAKHAVMMCSLKMAGLGFVGYEAGVLLGYFLSLGTASMPLGLAGAAVGAYSAYQSPTCADVRNAVRYWNNSNFGLSSP